MKKTHRTCVVVNGRCLKCGRELVRESVLCHNCEIQDRAQFPPVKNTTAPGTRGQLHRR